jgi:Protein of unknown function (DUF3037)
MPDESRHTLRYRILRYTPNLIRDEWVNIGVFLEEVPAAARDRTPAPRRAMRLLEEASEFARVHRLHPAADETLLRALAPEFDERLRAPETEVSAYLAKLELTLSNVLQFSPQRAVLAEDFEAEMDRLYREHVAPPLRGRGGILENTRAWIRARMSDVFRRHRILARLEKRVRVEEFTQPGDPLRIDYGYRCNGTRGYVQAIALARDPAQAKVFAYTAECIRARGAHVEFTAITESAPALENMGHQFVARLFEEQQIAIVPLARVELFADSLRSRL